MFFPALKDTLRTAVRSAPARARALHPAPRALAPKHTTDTYQKEVDAAPPADASIHRVDAQSDAAQKPHEPPSGEWSRAGTQTDEYRTVDREEPYDVPGGQDAELRYGGKARKGGDETSHPGEGPEGGASGGRKPEGR